jgi:YVTN family beta-propeller protein
MRSTILLSVGVLALFLSPVSTPVAQQQSPAAKRASSAIALTADGATLLAVNPDSNSLSVVDTAAHALLAEIPVGLDPCTVAVDDAGRWAYVANRGSADVSVIDLQTCETVAHIAVGYRPYGLVVSPDGVRLYVAIQGEDRLVVVDTATLRITHCLPVADRPSGLALSADGQTLYLTHLLQNTLTILPARLTSIYLPLILKTHISPRPGTLSPIPQSTNLPISHFPTSPLPHFPNVPLWPDSNLLQSIVLSPDGTRAYLPHSRSNTANHYLTFDTTILPLVSLVDLESNQHLVGQQFDLGTLDPPGVGLPFDAALTPDGGQLWVLNAASNDISVLDLAGRHLVAHIEVGDNPRGIVLSPDGSIAYVNNTLDGTLSLVDTAAYTVTSVITLTQLPLPPLLLEGKRLFHSSDDPRLARAQWIACNSCHFEAEHDGRTWFFGFAGPRNTTSLLGMVETYPLRWSGEWDESADAEFVVRKENFGLGLLDGELHCALSPPDCVNQPPNQGRSAALDALAAYLDSLALPRHASHADGEPLSPAAARGQALFLDPALGCLDCHPPPLYTDLQKHNVGTVTPDERIGPAYDTPTLRGLYGSAPYFHDGSAATLYDTLVRPTSGGEHDVRGLLDGTQIWDMVAFLQALPLAD